jgi:hypothetical protein
MMVVFARVADYVGEHVKNGVASTVEQNDISSDHDANQVGRQPQEPAVESVG